MSYFIPSVQTDYSSAFPPLPWTFSNKTQSTLATVTSSTSPPDCFFTPPKYPSYLKHTSYANLVLEQYHDKKSKNSHALDIDLCLPQFWQKDVKSRHAEIGTNGYDLTYSGLLCIRGKSKLVFIFYFFFLMGVGPGNSISMRTNFPMRSQCGIYYYEIRVLKRGQDGHIAVGFCRLSKLDKLPGIEYSFQMSASIILINLCRL